MPYLLLLKRGARSYSPWVSTADVDGARNLEMFDSLSFVFSSWVLHFGGEQKVRIYHTRVLERASLDDRARGSIRTVPGGCLDWLCERENERENEAEGDRERAEHEREDGVT